MPFKMAFVAGKSTKRGADLSKKGGLYSSYLSQPHRHPFLFDAKYPLTSKNSPPILPSIESNTLSNKQRQFHSQGYGQARGI
ncbi:MAG: hypothetical protein AAB299_05960 [Thermodesulfobacteriota bacterium]